MKDEVPCQQNQVCRKETIGHTLVYIRMPYLTEPRGRIGVSEASRVCIGSTDVSVK